ncbi:MAG: 50S ribosomal protein L30 [Bacillota bacterium]|nr:50S ribosomal protein L30 [Bacillota bacterium]
MAQIEVKQVKSSIGCKKDQIATLEALGLKKVRDVKVHEDNAVVRGMINKVVHLVELREV